MAEQNEDIIACVDETIKNVCKRIQEKENAIDNYYTVRALALLVQARGSLLK